MPAKFAQLLPKRAIHALVIAAAALGVVAGTPAHAGSGAATLAVTPLTWNVVGLDSNNVTTGPDTFPVGVRVCNLGAATATNAAAALSFDTANSFINSAGPTTVAVGDLDGSACTDAYFNVQVTRDASAYDTTREYHVTATADGVSPASSPTPRELYVEHLISQNRNAVLSVATSAIDAPGHATFVVGQTYQLVLTAKTATQGYEQLEAFESFPGAIFHVDSVSSTYAVPPAPARTRMRAAGTTRSDRRRPRAPTSRARARPTTRAARLAATR